MGRKFAKFLAVVGILLILSGILAAAGWYLQREFVLWNGALLRRDSRELDVSGMAMESPETFLEFPELQLLDARDTGMTPEQYVWLRQQLPRCEIRWDIPIQGSWYGQDTASLRLNDLTDPEMEYLQYITDLSCLDLGRWEDDSRIRELKERYPDLELQYQVRIGEEWWDADSVSLLLPDADPEELGSKLDLFPGLVSVMLTGKVPELAALNHLRDQYPDVFFLWKMDVLGMSLETDITTLDLSGVQLETLDELTALLPYFPVLEQVELGSVDAGELAGLAADYPSIRFRSEVVIAGRSFSTDVKEIDLSNLLLESTREVETVLPCFYNLEKVVMCECGISNEEMDALNSRYPDIRFVWSVNLGGILFRTDAIHFTPNRWGLKLTNEDVYPLRYCTDMICVDIGHQRLVTNCDWAAFMPKLKYLVLAETGISDLTPLTGLKELVFLELFLSPVHDYSPLVTCTALEDLNLCYTQGDPAPIGEMTWIKRLWWTGLWYARVTLPEKLGENTYLEFLSPSSTGKGWREGQHYYDMRDLIGMEYMTG
ncbi:MAG: hypothetical protein IKU68_06930 [Oscillospiraceae bacterium]|nr:hypothetical protein [Oscillospiraceae bacterium]